MKQIISRAICILAILILPLSFSACEYKEPSDPERHLSYRSDFCEETRQAYDERAKKIIEEDAEEVKDALHSLLSLEGTMSVDPSVYFVRRTLHTQRTKKVLGEGANCPVVLNDHALLLIPVFETDPEGATRIVGQITPEGGAEPLSKEELAENAYGFIYQRADSAQRMEELCQNEQLGEFKNATILAFDCYGKQLDTILLETDDGWYIFDPLHVKEQLEPGAYNPPTAKYDDETRIYDCAAFLEVYFDHLQRTSDAKVNLIKDLFS